MGGSYILKINNLCNLNCCFCADSVEIRSQPDYKFEQLKKGLKENRKKFENLIITGGEPTIYNKIVQLIQYAKQACNYKEIFLTTNGVLLYSQKNVDLLIAAGISTFLISFPTADERMYDAIVKKKGSFSCAVQGIKNLNKRNVRVRINTALHKLNYRNLADTVEFLANHSVEAIQLSCLNPVGSSIVKGKSAIALSYTEILPYIRDAFKRAHDIGFNQLFVENIPICVAPDLTSKISDLRKPDENKEYYNAEKEKPIQCKTCTFNSICDGTWRAYLNQFGSDEIVPITASESLSIYEQVKSKVIS